ncbi:MAG: SLC13/DASS family transporter [Bacteroidetes bacterium]|nr:MAG: SLC13/DASS family transporter [Bacteroidota bacterium]
MGNQRTKILIIAIGLLAFAGTILFTGGNSLFWNAIAVGGIMIYFWILEVIPIYLTALIPIIVSGPLGLLDIDGKIDASILAKSYGNHMVYIFLGGFMLALALEKWGIHVQIARRILRIIGRSKSRIILGFMISTAILSMWVSNTATALMLLPMALAVIRSLPEQEQGSKFSLFLILSIAYGASIGGVGTLVGSPPNLQMASILSKNYGIEIDFLHWSMIGFPICCLMILLAYGYILIALGKERKEEVHQFSLEKDSWNKYQIRVLIVFLIVVFLWCFKGPIGALGFAYRDDNVAILGALLLFLVPAETGKNLLEWQDTQKLPWGILLLFGGGLALADTLKRGGVIDWLTNSLAGLSELPYALLLLLIIAIALFATEIISNLALVTLMVPVMAAFAEEFGFPILQICVPITLASSFAFMLPISTPPNAIVFSSGQITIRKMAKTGFLLNLIGMILIFAMSWILL